MVATRRPRRAILVDVGGVLVPDYLTAAATAWGSLLGIAPQAFLDALFADNDEYILIGRTSETAWWTVVADRLQAGEDVIAEIRSDLAARQTWNTALLTCLRRVHDQTGIDADPTRTLFIGDTPSHVDAARSLSMTGHLHTDTDETIDRINDFVQSSN